MAKDIGKKKGKKPETQGIGLTKFQKSLFWATIALIPLTLFYILPIVCRSYFVKELKVSEEVFLSAPEPINLVSTSDIGPCYKITINGYTFAIPEKYTPSKIDYNEAEFRIKSRSEGRYIYLRSEKRTRTMNFNSQGITRWFLPSEARAFLPLILNANYHPFRLLFKSQFFASQGITSKIFTSKWDKFHVGYIFPTAGNEGYLGRIFRMNDAGTVEFLMSDSVIPVTLRDWVNIAMRIQTPYPTTADTSFEEQEKSNNLLLEKLIENAENQELEEQSRTLSLALNEFYRTKEPEWLIPVAIVMENRGFFPDVLDLISQYKPSFNETSVYLPKWNEIIDKAVAESLSIEAEPRRSLREFDLYCKNLTDLDINQIVIKIDVTSNLGVIQSFTTSLLNQSYLRSREEKHLKIKCPDYISVADAINISHRVTSLEFAK